MMRDNSMTMTPEQADWFSDIFNRLVANVDQVLLGKTFVIRLGFTALLSDGAEVQVGKFRLTFYASRLDLAHLAGR